jgi:hypothetical protein
LTTLGGRSAFSSEGIRLPKKPKLPHIVCRL